MVWPKAVPPIVPLTVLLVSLIVASILTGPWVAAFKLTPLPLTVKLVESKLNVPVMLTKVPLFVHKTMGLPVLLASPIASVTEPLSVYPLAVQLLMVSVTLPLIVVPVPELQVPPGAVVIEPLVEGIQEGLVRGWKPFTARELFPEPLSAKLFSAPMAPVTDPLDDELLLFFLQAAKARRAATAQRLEA
jgi:hypothetical protein